jgi:hypothetical protein
VASAAKKAKPTPTTATVYTVRLRFAGMKKFDERQYNAVIGRISRALDTLGYKLYITTDGEEPLTVLDTEEVEVTEDFVL